MIPGLLTKEQRHAAAESYAKEYQDRTGKGPGDAGYIEHYLCGYFGQSMSSSRGLHNAILEQMDFAIDTIFRLTTELDAVQSRLDSVRFSISQHLVDPERETLLEMIDSPEEVR